MSALLYTIMGGEGKAIMAGSKQCQAGTLESEEGAEEQGLEDGEDRRTRTTWFPEGGRLERCKV